jgi:hypothetical protein
MSNAQSRSSKAMPRQDKAREERIAMETRLAFAWASPHALTRTPDGGLNRASG